MSRAVPVVVAASLLAAAPALAADAPPPNGATQFNCDFEPACEVAPGVYGNLNAPASSKFNLAVGGFVKLDYAYNSSNFGPNGFFTNTRSPKNDSLEGQKDQSTFSARSSRIWFRSNGPNLLGGRSTALVELDFTNAPIYGTSGVANTESFNATPRLRHAWGNIDWGNTQLLFGQTTENFSVFNANSVDFNAGIQAGFGNGFRVPQVKLTQRVDLGGGNSLKLVAAVEQPFQTNFNTANANAAPGNTVGSAGDSWGPVPNFVGQAFFVSKALGTSPIAYGFGQQNLTAGFFGLYGNQHAKGQTNDKTIDSWGVGFYTFVPVIASPDGKKRAGSLTFEGQTYLAANVTGATAYQYTGTAGDLHPAKGFGASGHLIFYPTDQFSVSAGYGRRQAYNYGDYKGISNFEKYNETYFANAYYDLNAAVRVATEYQRLNTKYGNITVPATATATSGRSDEGTTNIARLALYYFF
ncbi:hypothetical protein KP001_02235 [Geomonas subterranea]|uniref:Porin n=1 Tax=Geomonas subterranea TaxID=2847989 RepID=A0ABX8LH74_9BACT|nr:hypothetical protein [Geomonas subterranea]QXE91385.1 hypothetical protein KP001_02235 [Geomonas subterranea]QXM10528.1 hypothetical protein KP002_05260 [Geomonas subterranea]